MLEAPVVIPVRKSKQKPERTVLKRKGPSHDGPFSVRGAISLVLRNNHGRNREVQQRRMRYRPEERTAKRRTRTRP